MQITINIQRFTFSLHSLDSLAQGNESIRRKEIVPWPIYRSIDLYRLIDRLDRKLGESWLRFSVFVASIPVDPSLDFFRRDATRKTESELLSSFSLFSNSSSTPFYFVLLFALLNRATQKKKIFHTKFHSSESILLPFPRKFLDFSIVVSLRRRKRKLIR